MSRITLAVALVGAQLVSHRAAIGMNRNFRSMDKYAA